MDEISIDTLQNKVWVTRKGVFIDRIASAWLIKRWIDQGATFKFTELKNYSPGADEIRFDMFDAEFTHEGNMCTFETLLSRAAIKDPALKKIGAIVHDIDLKDGKYGHEETQGIAHLLAGVVAGLDDDDERLTRGAAIFDDLYRYFTKSK